jgi:DNA helicase-2/ATP-dependent DNA helicase PcrA
MGNGVPIASDAEPLAADAVGLAEASLAETPSEHLVEPRKRKGTTPSASPVAVAVTEDQIRVEPEPVSEPAMDQETEPRPIGMVFNPQQAAAIGKDGGAYALNAGAGSGKTRVITERVGRLIEAGLTRHGRVLVLTFTVKAAGEFSTRMQERTGHRLPWATNFHRLCGRLLRSYDLGISKDFAILDGDGQEDLAKDCLRKVAAKVDFKKKVPAVLAALEAARMANHFGEPRPVFGWPIDQALTRYETELKARNLVDFDLMLYGVADGLKANPDLAAKIASKWDFVLVDEMQDTNAIQLELLKALAPQGNIMGVGDMDQGIYGFRGAVPRNLMDFVDYFGAEVLPLEHNYRSRKEILDVANFVIAQSPERIPKTLRDTRGSGGVVDVRRHTNQDKEAAFVAASIREAIDAGTDPGELAVLFRINAMSRAVESHLTKLGVPYGIRGGLRFWDREVVRDVVAYAKVLQGEDAPEAWKRALSKPARKAGAATLEKVEHFRVRDGLTVEEAFRRLIEEERHPGVASFLAALDEARAQDGDELTGEALNAMLGLSGYLVHNENAAKDPKDLEERTENITEAVNAALDSPTLAAYLKEVEVGMAHGADGGPRGVTVGTVHSVKGLEYGVVHLIGCHQGGIPFVAALKDPAKVEEECRLMYVSVTRAKDELHMHCPHTVAGFGGRKERRGLSQFLVGLDEALGVPLLGKAPAAKADADAPRKAKAKPRPKRTAHGAKEPAWMNGWRKKK